MTALPKVGGDATHFRSSLVIVLADDPLGLHSARTAYGRPALRRKQA